MQLLFKLLAFLAVPAAAFITFLIQPIIGKLLMPRYGGAAGTWMTISMFFQGALLAGYALAYWLLRKPRRYAIWTLGGLALAAPFISKLPPWFFANWPEWPAILTSLVLSLLPALLLTTSIGIVLQGWIRDRSGRVPFYLYGISNLGSTIALLIYPFAIETNFGLSAQVIGIKLLLSLLGGVVLGLCWLEHRRVPVQDLPVADATAPEVITATTIATWLLLAFSTCTLMLASIRILSAELGSNPYSWLIPLSIYLLSFTLTFSGWWHISLTSLCLVGLGGTLFGYMVTKGISTTDLSRWPRTWLVFTVLMGCMAGHGLVYELRPARRFSLFYLVLAIAGLLAGVFASVGAPALLSRNLEFTAAAFFLLIYIALHVLAPPGTVGRLSLAALLIVPPGWFAYEQILSEKSAEVKTSFLRNHYGTLILRETFESVTLSSETTLHGVQLRAKELRRIPTSYYAEGSAAGVILNALKEERPALQIGVIGLGAGTLAAYARESDHTVFWEINPLSVKVARERLTFLQDCRGPVDIRMADGRIGVQNAPEKFDVLIVDAFSGDSIPTHLITREAIQEYIRKLPNGILLVHVSNRYVDLVPVLGDAAQNAGWNSMCVTSTPNETTENLERASTTVYVVISSPEREPTVMGWINQALKRTDYDYSLRDDDPKAHIVWTDDRHAIVDVLNE